LEKLTQTKMTRRELQRLAVALPAPLALLVLGGREAGIALAQTFGPTPSLVPTPACGASDHPAGTPSETEGPYFKPDSPQRTSLLEPGMAGTKLLVTGYVYSTACRPVTGALLDFWQANDAGQYDNAGFMLRRHQFTDESGRFALTTIVPGLYPGRTRHIHVKVQAPHQPVLTTQLYFPYEPHNASDPLYNPALAMDVRDVAGGKEGIFTFALTVA